MAVKIIHDLTSVHFEDDLPLEPLLMQAVEHPNVLKLFEYKVARGQMQQEKLWLVLEFCNKGTLAVSFINLCFVGSALSMTLTSLWHVHTASDRGLARSTTLQDAVDKGYFRTSPVTSAPLLESAIVCVAKELASGFACLHANGILHCDISGGDFCHISNDMAV